jgi:hypothetical protein
MKTILFDLPIKISTELNDMCGIPEQLEETFIQHLKEIISDK